MAKGVAAVEAKRATQSIPIVMYANDLIGLGLVASLARPGGNVTGLSLLVSGGARPTRSRGIVRNRPSWERTSATRLRRPARPNQ
jgi:ABC transporter substrate binding protein